ncbi:hypothetical protein LSTR_LSTR003167 [Laodelphax striatellus]|uniref:Uncharacterized protein n=1 Tax=Laodelphax striatellus TaxID=195883 RepID=A0A482WWC8_LAOST|nr:hypothetical protein LSTR_LSTR003167 [Laodelphax striatellus]
MRRNGLEIDGNFLSYEEVKRKYMEETDSNETSDIQEENQKKRRREAGQQIGMRAKQNAMNTGTTEITNFFRPSSNAINK